MPINVSREDKATRVGAVAFCTALVAWYACGARSVDCVLDASRLMAAGALIGAVAFVVGLFSVGRFSRGAFGNAAFLGAGIGFLALMLGAVANRHFDRSATTEADGRVVGFHDPSKGPRRVTLQLQAQRVAFQADLADGCQASDPVTISVREGALGVAWVERLHCPHAR